MAENSLSPWCSLAGSGGAITIRNATGISPDIGNRRTSCINDAETGIPPGKAGRASELHPGHVYGFSAEWAGANFVFDGAAEPDGGSYEVSCIQKMRIF